MSGNETPKKPSAITVLSLLDSYNATHTTGSQSIKSCVLNITKARQLQGCKIIDGEDTSAYYSACQVREELLRARAIVTTSTSDSDDRYSLSLDGLLVGETTLGSNMTKDEEFVTEESEVVTEEDNAPNNKGGLRHRKKGSQTEETSEWTTTTTMEDQECTTNDAAAEEEEEMLRSMDPINLFGAFAPPSLKEAQKNAKKALSSYIEAANLAAHLLSLINISEKKV